MRLRSIASTASLLAVIGLCFGAAWTLLAAEPEKKPDSTEADYSRELPRIDPVPADKALETFTVADGFRLEQAASEPVVVDPVAMAFDEHGRLFVIEMRGYSEDEDKNLGRVRMLLDNDGDGRFETSTVYAEGLSWPTAVACYDGGVFVAAAPDIHYFKDNDGDGRADMHRVVMTGFGRGNVQGLVNTFKWGLDNRIHGATSSSGAEVRVLGWSDKAEGEGDAKENKEDARPLSLRGRDFAFDPKTLALEPTSGGGQHGLSLNTWGDKFVCSNSNHLQAVMFEDRYLARNPYLAAPSPRVSIAADGPQADVFRTSPVEPWRIVRTRLRVKGIVPGPVEGGGRAAGYFTGATGVTIYRGDDWPERYRGYAIVGDVGSNLVHRKRLDADGLGFVGRRVDEKSELLTSRDNWFRPVQFANAPDGSLYILDMYREVIEHPKSLHPVIKQHLDLTSGRDRGRIYRLVSASYRGPVSPPHGDASTADLVALLAHANGWHRETAARLLYERQDRAAVALLERQAAASELPEGRMHSLYALDGLGALTPEVILAALDDAHPQVRRHAVRLAERVAKSPQVREKLLAMIDDDDLHVRYQLAFTLGELSDPRRTTALAGLMRRDAEDGWIRLAALSSLSEGAGLVLSQLARDDAFAASDVGRDVLRSLTAQIGKQQRPDDVAAVLALLGSLKKKDQKLLDTLVQGLAAKKGSPLEKQLAVATGGRSQQALAEVVERSLKTATSDAAPVERVEAIALLRLGGFAQCGDALADLLDAAQPGDVQAAALSTLASYDAPQVAALLIDRWKTLGPRLRTRAGDVLFSRQAWLESLLTAIEDKRVALGDIDPGRLKLLATHRDASLRERAKKLLEIAGVGRRDEVVKQYRQTLAMPGDVERGRKIHRKICANCHKLEGTGHEVGPNLAAMRNRGPEAILLNVLDPNREVNPEFVSYALVTTDGRTLSGMIAAETATSVTLRRAEGAADTVLRIDIELLQSTGLSLMPEGMEKEIDRQAMADLLAYLGQLGE
ncbi:MAG: HEAT repeat domain-containing protein [Pirellulaceae bacterium]